VSQLSFGKFRHLQQCSTQDDVFVVLAIDHRANLVADMRKHHPTTDADVKAFKGDVLKHLSGIASAVLTDPDYGLPSVIDGAVPRHVGLLAPLEVTDYTPHPSKRGIHFIPGWDVTALKHAGCSGAKLLIYYHPDALDAADKNAQVDRIIEQCQLLQVPLFLEPILYSLDPSRDLSNRERLDLATAAARHFSRRGVDILKLEFPINIIEVPDESNWANALEALNAACEVPWTLLSAGVSFDSFVRQAELACQAGASGVIAGRAIWMEAVKLTGEDRTRFLQTVGVERMQRLADVCRAQGKSWRQKSILSEFEDGWYQSQSI
jgi:tagatose 1,6-diphosphate aldolase